MRGFRLEISERVPIEVEPNGHNERYLKTKREKLNHVFEKYLGRARDRTYEVVLKCMSYVLRYCDGQPRLPITVADQLSS